MGFISKGIGILYFFVCFDVIQQPWKRICPDGESQGSSDVLQREDFDGDGNFAEARGSSESCSFNTAERSSRQTAVSLTSASAGFAKGFGKKAVDKLGKALSGSSTNVSSSGSGAETGVPSSFHFGVDKSGHSSGRSTSGAAP